MLSSAAPVGPKELPGDEPDDVLFSKLNGVRLVELNRPKKLNSLNGSMVRKILPRLQVCLHRFYVSLYVRENSAKVALVFRNGKNHSLPTL